MGNRSKTVEIEHVARETSPLEDRVLLTEIVRSLVSRPAAVRVLERMHSRYALSLHIDVDPRDRSALLGRGGGTIAAIRQLFQAIGMQDQRNVEIVLDSSEMARPVAVGAR